MNVCFGNTGPRKGQKLLIPQFSLNLPFSPSRHSSFSPFVDRRGHVKCQDSNRPSLLFFLNPVSLISSLRHALPKASTGSSRKGNRLLQPLTQFSRMSLTSSPALSFILSTNIYGAGFVLSAGDTQAQDSRALLSWSLQSGRRKNKVNRPLSSLLYPYLAE